MAALLFKCLPCLGPTLAVSTMLAMASAADFSFSLTFGNNMILQRGVRSAVYGLAPAGSQVSVTLAPAGSKVVNLDAPDASDASDASQYSAIADVDGFWVASIESHESDGKAYKLTATSSSSDDTLTLHGVSFGDVYFCAGQSNMELGMKYTIERNESFQKISVGKYSRMRLFHLEHNPQPEPSRTISDPFFVHAGWRSPAQAMQNESLLTFSAACYYFGESLYDRLAKEAQAEVPIALIGSSFGGTTIESWLAVDTQLQCNNISCVNNHTLPFNNDTKTACLALDGSVNVVDANDEVALSAKNSGNNGFLYNGMVFPFINMAIKGVLWYQGENNLFEMAGNILDRSGYACMLQRLVLSWRQAWSNAASSSAGSSADGAAVDVSFGVVMLAGATDEGWGCNTLQMHWAETANVGFLPNAFMPGTFVATAHDLPEPWADECHKGAGASLCCVDTGKPPAAECGPHRGWLIQDGQHPGVDQPVTPQFMGGVHPRVKRIVGRRLAQAAWSTVYGHADSAAFVGPVIAGCSVEDAADAGTGTGTGTGHTVSSTSPPSSPSSQGSSRVLRMHFNRTLLLGDQLAVSSYNRSERASATFVLVDGDGGGSSSGFAPVFPEDAYKNYLYANRKPWWGDNSNWVQVDIELDASDPTNSTVLALLPASLKGEVTGVKYGHGIPGVYPQSGHQHVCCGTRHLALDPCPPASCPISSVKQQLPAMPFHARISNGKCKCLAPQTCDG